MRVSVRPGILNNRKVGNIIFLLTFNIDMGWPIAPDMGGSALPTSMQGRIVDEAWPDVCCVQVVKGIR
jgi:hypothetical protein